MAPSKVRMSNIEIENARIVFRNFAGRAQQFNPAGQRNFAILLDPNLAESLIRDGWNVKYLKPRDPEDSPQPYLKVKVVFENYPPKILLLSEKNKTMLGPDDVKILDYAEFQKVDLIINPSPWEVNGKSGVAAYLKTMYVTMVKEDFGGRYSDIPERDDAAPFEV